MARPLPGTGLMFSREKTIGGIPDGVQRRIGFQGERGAFSEMAATRLEPGCSVVPCRTLSDVFGPVESGDLDAGVVPVENSLAGSIHETYDLLLSHNLTITGETVVTVDHCLMALPGTSLADVREVLSHPQALAQCAEYLSRLSARVIPVYDTAGAAKMIREGPLVATAAVASEGAAKIYGLDVLARSIQTRRDNSTRFYRIEREARPVAGRRNKSVLALGLPNVPGSLFMALSSLAGRGINLTRIESRPANTGPWQYVFYLEFLGYTGDWPVRSALEEMKSKASMCRLLGSFAMEAQP